MSQFVNAAERIGRLAHDQVVVCPYSRTHETETLQWRDPQQNSLWEFIKRTSRGHEFYPEYRVKHAQIIRGFERFLKRDGTEFQVELGDALKTDINDWDDYFWIDVSRMPQDAEAVRKSKQEAVSGLINLFQVWRNSTTTFEEHRSIEMAECANIYLQLYFDMSKRAASGDLMARLYAPIDSQVVESLLAWNCNEMDFSFRLKHIMAYFQSTYFRQVPQVWIEAGLFAGLKERVERGQYQNPEKAKKRLRGLFYDIQFISLYAPYCHAMFIDSTMFEIATDKRVGIADRFGTRLFSRSNWREFIEYLDFLENSKTEELELSLKLVHP
ncbi:MAG: hypothetical protein PHU49_08060 [Syntrophorhabdaceae bacterium]|nr:hypothetical protein [Syntrophorhabdaceae bacterium]